MALSPIIPLAGLAGGLLFFLTKKSSASPEGQGAPPGALIPGNSTASLQPIGPRPTSELSDAQRERMAIALGKLGVDPGTGKLTGNADADDIRFATQVVGELETAGFKDAAKALREYVDAAAREVATPAEANPIAQAAAAVMTKEQADYVARVLALERDPNKIALLIDWLRKLAPSPQRDTFIQMAQALALQLQAANVTTQTIDQIDQVIKSSPEEPDSEPSGVTAPPAYTSTSPGVPQKPPGSQTSPTATTPLPSAPASVPAAPVPQTPPAVLTEKEVVARAVGTHLLTLQQKHGIKAAKGKQDQMLVKKFQTLMGSKPDGMPGPATFILLATQGVVNLPLVYYWDKAATAARVAEYREMLEKVAQAYDQKGMRNEASTLRASLAREHGEGGINGPLYGASAAPQPAAPKPAAPQPAAPKPTAAPAASASPLPSVIPVSDPTPGARLIKRGSQGVDVKAWQSRLNSGVKDAAGKVLRTYPAGAADGIFGAGTESATKAFQRDAGLTADGVVGPASRAAAKARGMW